MIDSEHPLDRVHAFLCRLIAYRSTSAPPQPWPGLERGEP